MLDRERELLFVAVDVPVDEWLDVAVVVSVVVVLAEYDSATLPHTLMLSTASAD